MTNDEKHAVRMIRGAIELLRNAIVKGKAHRELEFRVRDILADIEALEAGHATTVSS